MTTKRLILIVITIVSVIPLLFSIIGSISQPQIQSNLQLYQTNLVLQASELSGDNLAEFNEVRQALLGKNTDKLALSQYQEARELSQKNLDRLESNFNSLNSPSLTLEKDVNNNLNSILPLSADQKQIQQEIQKQAEEINKLALKIGLLEAHQKNVEAALKTWKNIASNQLQNNSSVSPQMLTDVLINLWSPQPQILDNSETIIKDELTGWFRDYALTKLYQLQDSQANLISLQTQQQEVASQAIIKLTLVAIIPILGGLIGFGLLIFLLIQLFLPKGNAILAIDQQFNWQTPWTAETFWQVLVVGFFFVGQIVLPIIFSFLNIDLTNADLRGKAIYVLVSYLAMALGGLGVLYFSIKPFFPLPKDWFKFKLFSNWIVWGVSGYLVALPLVVIVSLINQQIWQGQGGSNPLLSLALEAQDNVVLGIFYFTAAIAAPVYEEIMFRGFLLPSLTRYFPVWGAIILSSLIFAVAHLNLSEVLPLAILGIVLGVVYTRSRNLLSSMLVHSLWNSGTLISLFLLGSGSH
ncbi:CPBP family intramembrane glutamic endopeptidase [Crocosphaera sp. XPORK-15E]|uniref:CPBP family intramembrane glutamic endopeptidase n=1 Tax=Crocosphaera sp. XPORK-15E TaxID=3110247 RepID=UPI002B2077CA|nr:CPBP family intramembrane glutamic endopeptidase [Crocosphaera sp. XPORK-15E]MEA5534364.1 CPBP family intramembrane glutamic endopeptidase [Crocosphaera sp. XPORK-15E]